MKNNSYTRRNFFKNSTAFAAGTIVLPTVVHSAVFGKTTPSNQIQSDMIGTGIQILKNLYQVSGDLNGLTFDLQGALWNDANSYILKTPEGLVMFDCGCGDTMEQIFRNMKYWDLSPNDIKYCFLTHPHLDHAGGAHILKNKGVRFIAVKETSDAVASGDERCAGYLYHKKFTPVVVDRIVSDGDVVEILGLKIKIGHYPGHSMGCTAYSFDHENRRITVSGDIIGTLLAGDFGWDGSFDFDKKIYIESLRKFAKVEMDMMLPGHGLIYFYKPQWRVEEALNSALIQWR